MTSNTHDDIQHLRQDMNNELLASLKREMKARDEIKRREAYELELREQIAAWKLKADEATRLCRPDLLYNTSPSFQIPGSISYPHLSHQGPPDDQPAIVRHNELRNPRPESLPPGSGPHSTPSPVAAPISLPNTPHWMLNYWPFTRQTSPPEANSASELSPTEGRSLTPISHQTSVILFIDSILVTISFCFDITLHK